MKSKVKKVKVINVVPKVVKRNVSKHRVETRGRHVDPYSMRQIRLAALESKRKAGIYAGPGRPPKGAVKFVKRQKLTKH